MYVIRRGYTFHSVTSKTRIYVKDLFQKQMLYGGCLKKLHGARRMCHIPAFHPWVCFHRIFFIVIQNYMGQHHMVKLRPGSWAKTTSMETQMRRFIFTSIVKEDIHLFLIKHFTFYHLTVKIQRKFSIYFAKFKFPF